MTGTSKNILITGGTSGLGLELVKHFMSAGYKVYALGRDLKNISLNKNRFHFIKSDLADLSQLSGTVRDLLDERIAFDVVINNAGVLGPSKYKTTKNGFEYTFQVNFLSHLLIDEMILCRKADPEPLNLVSITSPVYKYYTPCFKLISEEDFHSFRSYSESKIYLLLVGGFLAEKYPEKTLSYFSFNPGIFRSGISRMKRDWFKRMYRIGSPLMRNPSNIALRLKEIIVRNEIINGNVYKSESRYKFVNHIDKMAVDSFMERCYELIEPYTR
jgi:NAD(P)-dependent dehydrogenase (short-subunit alcohol dehydrogenase family)